MYKEYQARRGAMTFDDGVSLFRRLVPEELDSAMTPFTYTGSDSPLYLYRRFAMTLNQWEAFNLRVFTFLDFLDPKIPVLLKWPPFLHSLPPEGFCSYLNSSTTFGPLTKCVSDFLIVASYAFSGMLTEGNLLRPTRSCHMHSEEIFLTDDGANWTNEKEKDCLIRHRINLYRKQGTANPAQLCIGRKIRTFLIYQC